MSDLNTLIGDMKPEGEASTGQAAASDQQPSKRDKNKPVPWVPRKKTASLEDVKKAVENEQWDKAFMMFMQLDEKTKADPVAKQIAQLLTQKLTVTPK